MADSKVKVDLEIATQAAQIALKQFEAAAKQSDTVWNIFKGNLAAQISLDAIKGAISVIGNFGKQLITKASESEQALKNLSVALQSAGLVSQTTYNDLADYAEQLEKVTQFSSEAILGTESLLASLTNLDKDGIKQATAAATDLAASLNIDLDTATKLIVKGINGNTEAFKKYGLEVEKGKGTTENFANVLETLSKFQGNATKQTDTFIGAQAQLENAFDDVYKALGALITQNPAVIKIMKDLTVVFSDLSKFVSENSEDIILFGKATLVAAGLVATATAASIAYSAGIAGIGAALTATATAAGAAWAIITGPVGLAVIAVAALSLAIFKIAKNWDQVKIATLEATATVIEYGSKAAGIFSNSASSALKARAQSMRDEAQAIRESIKAQEEKLKKDAEQKESNEQLLQQTEDKNVVEKLSEERAKLDAEEKKKRDKEQAKLDKEALERLKEKYQTELSFSEELIKRSLDLDALAKQQLEEKKANAEFEKQLLKEQLDEGLLNYFDYQTKRDEIDAEFDAARAKVEQKRYEDESARIQTAFDVGLLTKAQYNQAQMQLDKEYADSKSKTDLEIRKRDEAHQKDLARLQKTYGEAKLSATAALFGGIADLAALGGEKNFKIVKAFNLAEAITAGVLSIQKAAASAPPPFNIPAIVQASVTSAVNVARIASTKPSFATGGVVGGFAGASLGGDNVNANVRTGEMILNAAQQRNLFDVANGSSNPIGRSQETTIVIPVNIDGREVARAVSVQVANGFQLGEVF